MQHKIHVHTFNINVQCHQTIGLYWTVGNGL